MEEQTLTRPIFPENFQPSPGWLDSMRAALVVAGFVRGLVSTATFAGTTGGVDPACDSLLVLGGGLG